ncbi:hypothetical protein DBV15_08831 [Temnothorax longispinosus]|uniref:Uncharacterized protein n=1 Tax=Temnothorax longispinosus TaxID=300112 RepID=A0A4S2JEV8_9HYME|nr:hypothetical protein DBV15_08831 [Temnothorax longispinosus]
MEYDSNSNSKERVPFDATRRRVAELRTRRGNFLEMPRAPNAPASNNHCDNCADNCSLIAGELIPNEDTARATLLRGGHVTRNKRSDGKTIIMANNHQSSIIIIIFITLLYVIYHFNLTMEITSSLPLYSLNLASNDYFLFS